MDVCFCAGCSGTDGSDHLTTASDYSKNEMWFDVLDNMQTAVDVFYITPTCIWDW